MRKYDVCLCEPFILPGILPTLGTPVLKAVLNEIGVKSHIFYPSLHLFSENHYYDNPDILKCISNIPLQFSEFLFNRDIEEGISFLKEKAGIENETAIRTAPENAGNILQRTVSGVCDSHARILSYSLTFGDYNFAFSLFRKVKASDSSITVIVGGSMCTPGLAKEIMTLCPEIDYVICDEDVETYKCLVKNILDEKDFDSPFVATKEKEAQRTNKITDLNHLPCPDYSDFLCEIERLNLRKDAVIVPYEISRGCWWGEKKSCAMCGYFGYQKCFLIKSPEKVISDLETLKKRYDVHYVRFTDLVEPHRDYLKKLLPISALNMNFFWELRPNINESDIALLRTLGVFYSQIGFESLSTEELKHIHKGTTAINNIYLLILLMSYKIRIDWNYLYGFSDDESNWYESVLPLIPLLYHLFPPDLRHVWINRESRIFLNSDKSELKPVGSKIFHKEFSDTIEVFYQSETKAELQGLYDRLSQEIAAWKKNFFKGYQLCIVYDTNENNCLHIMRDYGNEEHFYLKDMEAAVYICIFQPTSIENIISSVGGSFESVHIILQQFIDRKIAIYADGKYLALAVRSTIFRWKKYDLLRSLFE